ncbi:deoxyribonuclease tatdn3 [Basidiobolus meristosporus CBS 931.73]|uniref:Deoxyribonuclease tatdn3 n=1 Tax=Basidiobolus meristosporus CBS 931.73 TaxID=1314790 RepID=A0A1Y1Z1A8_9FUNG|nr:deoxyribonuclease tatdn3 [Basidiobolus meristosporus CBS 931.73]|eukprot:ORY04070.1 deoxyribonuclease tatdn3 [Basidiobolus meristosporus CBS 931.73]
MFDCHAHIYPSQFPGRAITDILQEAKLAGVKGILSVPEKLSDVEEIQALALLNPIIKPCAGLHPVQVGAEGKVRSVLEEEVGPMVTKIRELNGRQKICAIGEIGLDFSPHVLASELNPRISAEELKEQQRRVFSAQLVVAKELSLAVNVHSRSAGHHAISLLEEHKIELAVLHAYDGKASSAKRGVDLGYYFSIPPSIIRSPQKQKLVAAVPLSNLLLETDSPALGPEKGVDNVPSNLIISAQEIARIKDISVDEVIRVTSENALKLFPSLNRNE